MKKLLLTAITAGALALGSSAYALNASDNGGNYSGGWTNGANGGTGFGAWTINVAQGTGFAGNFIGDPGAAQINGMATNSFGLYANPTNSGAFVDAGRSFASALAVGDTFSFQWGVNWDSGGAGNKGFNLYSGGIGGTQLLNVNMGGTAAITLGGSDIGFAYGTNVMNWSFTLTSATSLSVVATARDGVGANFTTNVTISGGVDAVKWYSSEMQDSNANRQAYFNNLQVVPEPSTYALLALSAAGFGGYVIRRRRK